MITIHYEIEAGYAEDCYELASVTVLIHEKHEVCRALLNQGYYLVGES